MEIVPAFSKNQVRKAGDSLCSAPRLNELERQVVDYWRAAHQRPLDRMSDLLESYVTQDEDSFAVCRLKRIDSIKGKLERKNHTYKLNSMYDIAGCRYVTSDIRRVYEVAEGLARCPEYCRHKDYIAEPQITGYRGIHLIHQFDSPKYGYENLKVETQIRTNLQHMWATAVEVYDVVAKGSLKFGGGELGEKRFFALVSELFTREEGTEHVPGTPVSLDETIQELKLFDASLHISSRLKAYSNSVSVANDAARKLQADYVLLMIDFELQQIEIATFPGEDEVTAVHEYSEFENRKSPTEDAVLLKSSSMDDLQRAYPNYYSDISLFLAKLDTFLA